MKNYFSVLVFLASFFGFVSLASAVWEEVPVSNPGAETGDMTGWDATPWDIGFIVVENPDIAYEGDYYFFSQPSLSNSNYVSTSQNVDLSDYTGSILNVEVSAFCKSQSGQRWGYDDQTNAWYLYDWKTWLTVNAHSDSGHLFGITFFLLADNEWHEQTIPLNLRLDWKEKRVILSRINIMAKAQYSPVEGSSPASRDIEQWGDWVGDEPTIVAYDAFSVAVETDSTTNSPPVADAGYNQVIVGLSSVTLDGSQSLDPENDDITYTWTLDIPAGSSAVLDDATSATPSFTADTYGDYVATLVVADSKGLSSDPDRVAVSFYLPSQFSELDSSFGLKTITVDHQTDKKWLDLNLTTNRSYDEIVAEMLPGGDFEGFRHATTDEVLELFSNAGFSFNAWTLPNHNAFNHLVPFIGISFEIPDFPTMHGLTGDTTGTPPDVLVELAVAYKEDRPENVSYQKGVAYDISPGYPSDSKYEVTGHWLIAVDDNTLPGNNVEVSDEETGTTVTFGTVTAGGVTSVELVEIAEGPPPPAGFAIVPLGMYYDIDTTAEFSGLILIEIEYDDTGLTEGEETALKLKHYDEAAGIWEDKTTSVDIANNIIYGETNHLSFFAITMPRLVEIDIKPGSYPNSINPNAGGVIPVAILTTDDFDASNVDPETVALDGEGARSKGKSGKFGSLEDVDGDGDLDLVVQIENVITWDLNATEAMLTGETYDGIFIEGTDSVRIVPPE